MDKIRLDKWLWAARFYKTRSLAVQEIGKGRVLVNDQPAKPAREVAPGDLVTVRKEDPALHVRVMGISGVRGSWLWIAGALVAIECAVFAASGMKCPLTAVAARFGPGMSDTFLPERFTHHTFRIFTPLIGLGALLVLARMLWLGWA